MKALVLSGGAGTRLRPITHTSAKQLVPVANKPILFYCLEDIVASGVTDIGIVVGHTAPEVMEAVGDGSRFGARVTYLRQDAPLGLAHCVRIARDFLGEDEFIMYLGDNLLREGVADFVERFSHEREVAPADRRPVAQLLLAKVPDPHRFGVAELDAEGHIKALVEKPVDPPSDLALVGVYLFDATIHTAVDSIVPSARGELEITDAIQWLIDQNLVVRSEIVDGYWKDLGELDALLEGNRLMLERLEPNVQAKVDDTSRLEGRVVIGPGSIVENSTVRGPAIIGHDVILRNAYIGPFTSIADGCEIIESEVEHSMILERSRLVGVGRIEDSLIGRDVEVTRSKQLPRATRVMIGDHSKVDTSWG